MLGLACLFPPVRASRESKSFAEVVISARNTPQLKFRGIIVDTIRTISKDFDVRTVSSMNVDSNQVARFISEFEEHRIYLGDKAVKLAGAKQWMLTTDEYRLHPLPWIRKYEIPFANHMSDNYSMAGNVTHFCGSRQLITTETGCVSVAD